MIDRGFFITRQAIRRQLAAMPHDLYLVSLIHNRTRRAFPGERLWTAGQLGQPATLRFLRVRNREGCDVYVHPYADGRNAGYILIDLDNGDPRIIETMRAQGHGPCVVLETSPGHLQTWVRVSHTPLPPAVATQIGRELARTYGGDLASTDWRHLGRLAGFTNQKPQRRHPDGYAPWVKLLHAQAGLATGGAALLEAARRQPAPGSLLTAQAVAQRIYTPQRIYTTRPSRRAAERTLALEACADPQGCSGPLPGDRPPAGSLPPASATPIYQHWMNRLRIRQRFPQPDWSIADKWIAKELLWRRVPATQVQAVLRLGSPGFPRLHGDPDDYLRRTIARALLELEQAPFPARHPRPQLHSA